MPERCANSLRRGIDRTHLPVRIQSITLPCVCLFFALLLSGCFAFYSEGAWNTLNAVRERGAIQALEWDSEMMPYVQRRALDVSLRQCYGRHDGWQQAFASYRAGTGRGIQQLSEVVCWIWDDVNAARIAGICVDHWLASPEHRAIVLAANKRYAAVAEHNYAGVTTIVMWLRP